MALHKNLPAFEIHQSFSFVYVDEATRLADTGFSSSDINKLALETSTNRIWRLTNHSPITWIQLHANATLTHAGFMSAEDKIAIDAAGGGAVTFTGRNETGSTLLRGKVVTIVDFSTVEGFSLLEYADKDDPTHRPAVGILTADIPNNSNGTVMTQGTLSSLDTSAFSITDQLVLGDNGDLTRPPPDNTSFTGEIQNLASVSRVHATLGRIVVFIDGLNAVTGDQVFALAGTDGTPSDTNHYVTDSDPRNTNSRIPTGPAGGDLSGTYPNPTVSGITETSGPTSLDIGDIVDGEFLFRSGTTIMSAAVASLTATITPIDVDTDPAVIGISAEAARADHKHDIMTASGIELTDSTNAEGTSISLARADHSHSHGSRAGGSLHAEVTTSVAGFMSATDKIKVDSISSSDWPRFTANDILFPSIAPAGATSRNGHALVTFDDTTDENILLEGAAPSAYDGSASLQVLIDWIAASATSGDVKWDAQWERDNAGGHDIDADDFAAAQTVTTTTAATSGIITRTTITFTNAQADGIQGSDAFRLKITRDADEAGDTMVGDAQILRISTKEA